MSGPIGFGSIGTPRHDLIDDSFAWPWHGRDMRVGLTSVGRGPTVLMLPAPSSISSRAEMKPLQIALADRFRTIAVDLPGFGADPKDPEAWSPATYRQFVSDILEAFPVHGTVAVGHTATYLLGHVVRAPGSAGRVCLIAPTWRGPLPTMLGRRPKVLPAIARLADIPVLGSLVYRTNVNRWTIRMMANGHVYADRGWLAGDRLAAKLAVTNSTGARHGSVRFVCGALDPVRSTEEFLSLAARLADDVLVICGSSSPRRSMAEMQQFGKAARVRCVSIERGKLGVHEEFPAETAAALLPFLCETRSRAHLKAI